VRGVELDILEDVEYGGEVVASTEVSGFRRVIARRRSEFRRQGSERTVAIAITDWVLLNADGRPVRPPPEILDAFTATSEEFSPLRVRLKEAPASAKRAEFPVRMSETDPMAHVNNAAYIDYVDERFVSDRAGEQAPLPLSLPRRYRAEFVGSAVPGTMLVAHSWAGDRAWSYLLRDADGREVLRASVETDPATWVGG
jgi:acyl-ACP thioesterase